MADARKTPREGESQELKKGSRLLIKEMENASKVMRRVVKAEEELAKAAAGAAKSAKGALADFDQLDVLARKSTSTSAAQGNKEEELTTAERFPGMGKGQGGLDHQLRLPAAMEDAPIKDELYNLQEAFQEMSDGIGATWQDRMDNILEMWTAMGSTLTGSLSLLLPTLCDALSEGWEETIQPILDSASQKLNTLWTEQIVPNFNDLMKRLSLLISQAPLILENFIQPVTDAFGLVLMPGATSSMQTIGEVAQALGQIIAAVSDGIIGTLSGILQFLAGGFTSDWSMTWDGIRKIFSAQWDAMLDFAKGTVNAVIALINAMIRSAADGINYIIRQLNKISFEVPDWVPGIGGQSWGIHIDPLTPYQIPMLATGAVIPPGAEFLAVLGDQRSGRNLEAPEGLIRQIVREESGGQEVRLNVSAKGTAGELVRWLRFEMDREDTRHGQSLVKGGSTYALY